MAAANSQLPIAQCLQPLLKPTELLKASSWVWKDPRAKNDNLFIKMKSSCFQKWQHQTRSQKALLNLRNILSLWYLKVAAENPNIMLTFSVFHSDIYFTVCVYTLNRNQSLQEYDFIRAEAYISKGNLTPPPQKLQLDLQIINILMSILRISRALDVTFHQ